MFDTYLPRSLTVSADVRSTATVHEHRAPTDASIKLAAEYQDKARQQLVDEAVHIEQSGLRLKYAIFREDFATADHEIRWQFELDGVPQNGKLRVPYRKFEQLYRGNDKSELYKFLAGEIAKVVAHKVALRLLTKQDEV